MNKCKTCKWWQLPEEGDHWIADEIAQPTNWNDGEPIEIPTEFEVRYCCHPRLLFCERPLEKNGFAVADGSTYAAELFTAEDFGCVRHSDIDTADYDEERQRDS